MKAPVAVDPRTGREVMPLDAFPAEMQAEYKRLAALPKPPPRWRRYWFGELPSRAFYEWYAERGIDPDKRRESIPDFMKEAVVRRDQGHCGICGKFIGPDDKLYFDHIMPVSLGGRNSVNNLQLSHSTCNIKKGARV